MSIGNTSLHQSGEIPEIVKLPNGRIRVTRRFHKFTREDIDNANLGSLMGDFGDLDIAGEQISNQGYTNCRLISVEVDTRFNSVSNTDSAVLVKTYETLTAVWTKERDDEVTSTDNGLRVLERSEVANLDGFPIVQLSSPNGSKVVLSGMGNASNYFVLLVKANSANTIYWRATNEALATQTGSFTTANTDQWEYKVIYTPISIDQLEIGYDGTNYSTFNLSEFYLVSQSSDWQNNVVESFIKFEVTVDNSSPFTDTVVFTGSNGNTATGTNVQGGGTGSISSPYDEDDVGVATITDGGKTLYLASFQDQTGAESNAQVGRVVTRWAEAGTLNRSEDKVGSQLAITIEAFGEVPDTPSGYSLARTDVSDFEGIKTNRYTFLEPSILSVSTPKVGGQQRVQVQAFNLSEATVVSEVSEVTASHELVDITTSDVEGIPTRNFTFDVDNFDVRSTTDNGLLTITRTDLGTVAYSDENVGVDTITDGAITLHLAGEEIDNGNTIKKRVSRWAEAGVLRTSSRNLSEGVKEVTTVFLAVEGSTTGPIVNKSEENLQGLKTISVTTLQDKSGNSIVEGNENLVHRYQSKVDFTYPGIVGIRQDIITSDVGVDPNILNFELTPPVQSKLNGTISVIFQTSGNIVASDETYNDGSGAADSYWNPSEWARTYVSGIGWNYSAFSTSKGLRGYRVDTDVSGIAKSLPSGSNSFTSNGVIVFQSAGSEYINTASSETAGSIFARVNGVADGGGVKFVVDGKRIYANTPFILQASGGPVNPVGNRYVLDIDLRPAFEDVDGNIYYKKTIVTATP
jgi:hypothetical protein